MKEEDQTTENQTVNHMASVKASRDKAHKAENDDEASRALV